MLTLAWCVTEGKELYQHDVWRSRNVGDFSPVGEGRKSRLSLPAALVAPPPSLFLHHTLSYLATLSYRWLPARWTLNFSLSLLQDKTPWTANTAKRLISQNFPHLDTYLSSTPLWVPCAPSPPSHPTSWWENRWLGAHSGFSLPDPAWGSVLSVNNNPILPTAEGKLTSVVFLIIYLESQSTVMFKDNTTVMLDSGYFF